MSGNRSLNSKAMPAPMTPTQLTAFTRVWHWLLNMLPLIIRNMLEKPLWAHLCFNNLWHCNLNYIMRTLVVDHNSLN